MISAEPLLEERTSGMTDPLMAFWNWNTFWHQFKNVKAKNTIADSGGSEMVSL